MPESRNTSEMIIYSKTEFPETRQNIPPSPSPMSLSLSLPCGARFCVTVILDGKERREPRSKAPNNRMIRIEKGKHSDTGMENEMKRLEKGNEQSRDQPETSSWLVH